MKKVVLLCFILVILMSGCQKKTSVKIIESEMAFVQLSQDDPYSYFNVDSGEVVVSLQDRLADIIQDDYKITLSIDRMEQVETFFYITFTDVNEARHQVCVTNTYLMYLDSYYFNDLTVELFNYLKNVRSEV